MAKMDYKKDAQQIIDSLGGIDNLIQVFHCMTRVRVYVKNKDLIDEETIKTLPEVTGTNWSNDQFQIICGNYVGGIYDEMISLGAPTDDTNDNALKKTNSSNKKNSVWSNIIEAITGSMTPLIPALTASGMIKIILTLCSTFNWVSESSSTYQVINFVADSMYYFLPFFVAASAAKVFKVNQSMALLIAGIFLHPAFVEMIASSDPINFFSVPIFKFNYAYSVIPIILMVWIMSYISKFAKKVTPDVIRLILEPTLILMISAPIALIIIGPLGGIIGDGLANLLDFLSAHFGFIIVGILAAAFPYIVMTGMHHALTPIGLNAVATHGDTLIFVSQVCSNIAQGGAALGVAVKSKNTDMKQLGVATGISALMGITEPALYGVNLRLKRPVVVASIAAGIGGIIGGIFQVTLYLPQNSLIALPAFIGGESPWRNFTFGVIMILVTFISSFVLTILFGVKEDTDLSSNASAQDLS